MKKYMVIMAAVALCGCGEGNNDSSNGSTNGATNGMTSNNNAQAQVDCSDPDANPYAGTCVETFNADCWDPSGACVGEVDAAGNTTLEWDNGAKVQTTLDITTDPMNPGANTDLINGAGMTCSTATTQNMVDGCASKTVYTRESDGATMEFCSQTDGSVTVTCPDATTFEVTSSEASGADQCQYGDAEACEIDTSGIGGQNGIPGGM